jgi:antitoxin VapB
MVTAKLFQIGGCQAVRLPEEFRFGGNEVRIRRVGFGILLEPLDADPKAWFAAMDETGSDPIFPNGREQPPMPKDNDLFEK